MDHGLFSTPSLINYSAFLPWLSQYFREGFAVIPLGSNSSVRICHFGQEHFSYVSSFAFFPHQFHLLNRVSLPSKIFQPVPADA